MTNRSSAETVTRCARLLDGVLPRPLLDVLFDTGTDAQSNLRDTTFAQPALFAVEMGLARLWQSWGIEPDVVLGHSVGQYAAACVAGTFGLEEGVRLIAERGRLFGQLPVGGRMLAVSSPIATGSRRALRNTPRVGRRLQRRQHGPVGAHTTIWRMRHNKLSRSRNPLRLAGYQSCVPLRAARPRAGRIRSIRRRISSTRSPQLALVCNRTGKVLARQTCMDAQYWRRHAREPVRFADSVGTLAERRCAVLMELGPQPILTAAAMRTWPESAPPPQAIASLRRDADAQRCFTEALATAYVTGHRLDFASHRRRPRKSLDLPTYPFQRRAYWFPTTRPQLPSGPAGLADQSAPAPATGDWLTGMPAEEQLDRITELIRSELGVALRVSAEDIEPGAEFM